MDGWATICGSIAECVFFVNRVRVYMCEWLFESNHAISHSPNISVDITWLGSIVDINSYRRISDAMPAAWIGKSRRPRDSLVIQQQWWWWWWWWNSYLTQFFMGSRVVSDLDAGLWYSPAYWNGTCGSWSS